MGMPKVQNVEEETHAASEPHIFIHIDFDQRIISTNAQSRFQQIMIGILHLVGGFNPSEKYESQLG